MEKIGGGIIGCGWVAEEHIKAFQNDDRSQIRALVSRNPANAQRYRDRYNLVSFVLHWNPLLMTIDNLIEQGAVAHHPFRGQAAHFIDCITNNTRPFPDLADAAKTHAICFAADISAQQGKPVAISEIEG